MAENCKIEWTDRSWNLVTGCSKISPGCMHCYAKPMAHRLQGIGLEKYRNGFEVTTHEHMLVKPTEWRKPRMIFVNSMGDLFHRSVPGDFIKKVFEVPQQAPQHVYQF